MRPDSVLDVIMCLLEIVMLQPEDSEYIIMKRKLVEAGFTNETIAQAFTWLRDLLREHDQYTITTFVIHPAGMRIFSTEEMLKLSRETRGFIYSLEKAKVLDSRTREIVINQLMRLENSQLELLDVKWVVLLILISKKEVNHADIQQYLLTTAAMFKEL